MRADQARCRQVRTITTPSKEPFRRQLICADMMRFAGRGGVSDLMGRTDPGKLTFRHWWLEWHGILCVIPAMILARERFTRRNAQGQSSLWSANNGRPGIGRLGIVVSAAVIGNCFSRKGASLHFLCVP